MKRWRLLAILFLLSAVCLCAISASAETPEQVVYESVFFVNPLYPDLKVSQSLQSDPSPEAPATYHTTLEDAAAQLREGLEDRASSVTVGIQTTRDYAEVRDEIFDRAFNHTGVPTQGDYLLWHYKSCNIGSKGYTSNDINYYTFTFTTSYLSSAQQEAELDTAIDTLLTQLNVGSASDYEKICTVYDYLCQNITYDNAGLSSGDDLAHTAYAALTKKTAVCQGYASLFYRLALELDVDSRLIAGTGNGGAHGWNIVKLRDQYYNLDATWDATLAQADQPYVYFLKCEENFGDHTRYEQYTTSDFHSAYPMSATDYDPNAFYGTCGENLTWTLDDEGTLTISGSGAMTSAPWPMSNIKQVVICDGVTEICDNAFYNAVNLISVEIPDSVTGIGNNAFAACYKLNAVYYAGTQCQWDALEGGLTDDIVYYAAGEHAFVSYISDNNATCTGNATETATCDKCTATETREIARSSLGHSFTDYVSNNDATYTADGTKTAKCDRCEARDTQTDAGSMLIKNGWIRENGQMFFYVNGKKVTNNWAMTDDGWRCFDAKGQVVTNSWMTKGSDWYYLGADGKITTNKWIMADDDWRYLNEKGQIATRDWAQTDDGSWRYLNENGLIATRDWAQTYDGSWRYLNENGLIATNVWAMTYDGSWRYLNKNGLIATNVLVEKDGKPCYVGPDGLIVAQG